MKYTIIALSLFLSLTSFAKNTEHLPGGVLISTEDMASMQFSCKGKMPLKEITCDFIQKILIRNTESVAEVKKFLSTISIDDLKKEKNFSYCKKEFATPIKVSNAHAKEHSDEIEKNSDTLCNCVAENDLKCFSNAMMKFAEMKEKTCKVVLNSFSIRFKKISKDKWLSNPGPEGLCNLVNVGTLEAVGDSGYSWKYTQIRVASDKGEHCKFDLNKPTVYVTDQGIFKLNCEYIDLGSVF